MKKKFKPTFKKEIVLFMPFIGGGGVEKNLYLISNYLSKKLGRIFLITSSKKYGFKFNKKIQLITPKKNLSENLNIRFKYLICLFLLFKFLLKNRKSLVFSFQANIYCIILCKLMNVKIITRSNSSPTGWYHNFFKNFVYKKIINLSDSIIVNSIEFKKEMQNRYNVNCICIYNPLDKKEILKKAKKKINFNFFNEKIKLRILNIGRLTDQKDQITLLKSIYLLNSQRLKIKFKVLIMGRGVMKDRLIDFIKEKKLNKIVKIIKFQDNPYPYIKKCNLFVLTSKYEGLPNVLLESLVLKKFIISSNCPSGPKEILLNGKAGYLFKVSNHIDLFEKILKFIRNKKNLKHKINFGYKNLNKFEYRKNIHKYYLEVEKFLN